MNDLEEDIALAMKHLENDNLWVIAHEPLKSHYSSGIVLAIATYRACKKLIEEQNNKPLEG